MQDADGKGKAVPHFHTDESYRSIGIRIDPDDNNTLSEKVRVGFIRDHDAFQALNSTIMRSLKWTLSAIAITEMKCTQIMSPIIERVLAKL